MKKTGCLFALLLIIGSISSLNAQSYYSDAQVYAFKQGMLDQTRKTIKSLPIKTSSNLTLIAIGVTEDLITYKYVVEGLSNNSNVTADNWDYMKLVLMNNLVQSQKSPELFIECLYRTGLGFQFLFFSEERLYIGGFRVSYSDYEELLLNNG